MSFKRMTPITTVAVSLVAISFCLVAPAGAEVCVQDHGPAATLLLPYFEVNLDDAAGRTTIMSINNSEAEDVQARVVLWTDTGYPTLYFDLFMTGFDVEQVNLRDIFEGRIPSASPAEEAVGCPADPSNAFVTSSLPRIHTGSPSPFLEGRCAALNHGDNVARGYVTVDVVDGCEPLRPTDEGYFGAEGLATYRNALWGDFILFDPETQNAAGGNLVSLEADPDAFREGTSTFYGSYVKGTGIDGREPLPTQWSTSFAQGGGQQIVSSSVIWRETDPAPEVFDCGDTPSWHPLGEGEIVNFDQEGNAIYWSTDVVFIQPPEPLAPAATQRVSRGRAFDFGWEILDLNTSPSERRQSYVMELMESKGRYSVLRAGMPQDEACSLGGCGVGESAPVGELCIELQPSTESGTVTAVARVRPAGCFSSGCTVHHRTACQVRQIGDRTFDVGTSFCLRNYDAEACLADCEGGGSAACDFPALAMDGGEYTIRSGDLELTIGPTSNIDAPICIGSRF